MGFDRIHYRVDRFRRTLQLFSQVRKGRTARNFGPGQVLVELPTRGRSPCATRGDGVDTRRRVR